MGPLVHTRTFFAPRCSTSDALSAAGRALSAAACAAPSISLLAAFALRGAASATSWAPSSMRFDTCAKHYPSLFRQKAFMAEQPLAELRKRFAGRRG